MKNQFYYSGDKVEATGKEFKKYGETWVEFVYLDGHRKGDIGVTGKTSWVYRDQHSK